jgi:hypothetical protein
MLWSSRKFVTPTIRASDSLSRMPGEGADEKNQCRHVFDNGVRCRNDASSSGYCSPKHEPGHFSAAAVSAIAAVVSATMATIGAWPHLEPIIRTWLQTHTGFMSRAEKLLQGALDSGNDRAVNAAIQKEIDLLREEAAELQRAVYASQPISGGTKQKSAA